MPEELRGTYAGLATPAVIDYLRDLGVTAVELLPVHEFVSEPFARRARAWRTTGATTRSASSPRTTPTPPRATAASRCASSRRWCKALHAAGLEVILDVVYNHTAEGGPHGPTLSFRGLDDRGFYQRVRRPATGDPVAAFDDTYWDVTGCGNTVDASNPQALRLILDSLRYWVTEMHVDGFRFDLISALTRTGYEVDMALRTCSPRSARTRCCGT